MTNMRSVRGFTLLEAIVAMVIVSILSMSLYSWLNSSYVSANRAIRTLSVSEVIVSARAYVENVNPMTQPEGSYVLGDYFIRWTSEPVTEVTPAYIGGTPGLYDVALYRVDVELYSGAMGQSEEQVGLYSAELIGYIQAREPAL